MDTEVSDNWICKPHTKTISAQNIITNRHIVLLLLFVLMEWCVNTNQRNAVMSPTMEEGMTDGSSRVDKEGLGT